MRAAVGPQLGVKASGGIRTLADVAGDDRRRREPHRHVGERRHPGRSYPEARAGLPPSPPCQIGAYLCYCHSIMERRIARGPGITTYCSSTCSTSVSSRSSCARPPRASSRASPACPPTGRGCPSRQLLHGFRHRHDRGPVARGRARRRRSAGAAPELPGVYARRRRASPKSPPRAWSTRCRASVPERWSPKPCTLAGHDQREWARIPLEIDAIAPFGSYMSRDAQLGRALARNRRACPARDAARALADGEQGRRRASDPHRVSRPRSVRPACASSPSLQDVPRPFSVVYQGGVSDTLSRACARCVAEPRGRAVEVALHRPPALVALEPQHREAVAGRRRTPCCTWQRSATAPSPDAAT